LGEAHQSTLKSMNNLAPARMRVLDEEHLDTLTSTSNLSDTLEAQGDHDGALRLLRKMPRRSAQGLSFKSSAK
jgi:hypothetical protein